MRMVEASLGAPGRSIGRDFVLTAVVLGAVMLIPGTTMAKSGDLRNATVSPRSGTTDTTFQFGVELHDDNNVDRVVVRIDTTTYTMSSTCGNQCGNDDIYVEARKLAAGTYTVTFESFDKRGRLLDSLAGGSVQVVDATPTPTLTPTPAPTPKPTPKPTPLPTPKPTPKATPVPGGTPKPPTATPPPTPVPGSTATQVPSPEPSVEPSPSESPTPSPTPTTIPTPGAGGNGTGNASGSGTGGGPGADPSAARDTWAVRSLEDGGAGLAIDGVRLSGGLGAYAWLVPGFILGLPGLLVLVIIGLQVAIGSVFVPLTRRWSRSHARARRPIRHT